MSLLVRQFHASSPADVRAQLRETFVSVREAVLEDRAVVLCVDGPALLGQSSPEDAAVACGLLGMARALAFEGAAKGWVVNVIAVDPGTEPDPALVELAASTHGLTGQLLNVSTGSVGRIVP